MEPITRSEMLMDGQYVEPKTRKEKILAGEDLEPVTREEYFLKKYRHSGGDVDVVQLTATENKVYTAPEGKAYSPVSVNVPTPQPVLDSITINENGHFTPPAGTDGYDDITVYVPYVTQGTTINENGTYTPPSGVDGFGRVIVDVPTPPPSLQSLTASHNGYFLPSSGYVGFSEVNVDVALPQNAYLLESQKNDVVTIQHGAEFDMPKLIASIEPQQSGSGDPSPENVRPISGWTACNVVRCGANLWDEEWELGIYNTSTGEKQADNSKIRSKNYISVKPSNSYRIVIPSSAYCRYFCYDINKNLIITEVNQGSVEITTPNNCYFMTFNMGQEYGTTYNNDISINYPSTDTEYHAYNGNTYTIQFVDGSSPLIVYGSMLELVKVNGEWKWKLTADRSLVTYSGLDEEGWVGQDGTYGCLIPQYFHKAQTPISNIYKGVSPRVAEDLQLGEFAQYSYTYNSINIKTNYASLSDFKTSLQSTPLTVLFEIKVPQTYYINVDDLPDSLDGVNNIWADTGEVDVQIWTKEV